MSLDTISRQCARKCRRTVLLLALAAASLLAPANLVAYDNGVVPVNTPLSARRMITDLIETHGKAYPGGPGFLQRLDAFEKNPPADPAERQKQLDALIREAALANPILDFDKILLVRRKPHGTDTGLMMNFHCNDAIKRNGWDNEIGILSKLRTTPTFTPVHRQSKGAIMRDLDLHFDAKRFLFASINAKGNWAVFEMNLDGTGQRELSPSDDLGSQWFDACYLPEEGAILAFSTAGVVGIPCLHGGSKASSLYRVNTHARTARQLTFEQDSGWHPRPLHDGRIMYLRWQYTDTPHYFDRLLFTMLPDGRQQKALWGSGAFFPTAFKHPRPVPGHPSMILGVVGGHHALPEAGRLMLIDPNLGSHYPFRHDPASKEWGVPGTHMEITPRVYPKEVTGCVQEIPGHGRDVIGHVNDNQGAEGKYTFATPYPLNEKYYLTSLWIDHKGTYGLWLVDAFDNMVKLYDLPDAHIFEPTPIRPRTRPPVIPDTTTPDATEGTMFISDIYHGRGLPGIPRGTAKSLRIIAYHFEYWRERDRPRPGYRTVGEASSWDIKRVLGTVPIEPDGSAFFKVPSNTPISIQVLDKDNAAIQLMQSWTIAMPGENLSCVGCHEPSNTTLTPRPTLAANKPPRPITPWYGTERPFSFPNEIQPLLNRNCVTCHNDTNRTATGLPSFSPTTGQLTHWQQDNAYNALHPYVRRPGFESDIATKSPMDYHASTSELIQRLRRGHHTVKLTPEDWDRLHTWIDLNAPWLGTWHTPNNEKLRLKFQKLYGGAPHNPEADYRDATARTATDPRNAAPTQLTPTDELEKLLKNKRTNDGSRANHASIGPLPKVHGDKLRAPNWPLPHHKAKALQRNSLPPGALTHIDIPLPNNQTIRFVRIPAGTYIIGSIDGHPDERPRTPVTIDKPFWIAQTEITNAQYATHDPDHDTGYENEHGMDHTTPGYIANHPQQPVARISWHQAMNYCQWLSKRTGKKITLPTEAQWEWAARAGTDTAFHFGHRFADFTYHANLADASLRKTSQNNDNGNGNYAWDGLDRQRPSLYPGAYYARNALILRRQNWPANSTYPLRDDRFHDKWFTVDYVQQYHPNTWGLHDAIGNVWEWTLSTYAPYPYNDHDGRNNADPATPKTVRGGSHADRPKAIGSATRLPYQPFQKVHNVGFRPIIMEE